MVASDQRRGRYAYQVRVARDLEMDLAIGAGRELAVRIVGLQLNQHAARAYVHDIRSRDQTRVEVLPGILRHLEGRLQPWMEFGREGLRHLDVDPDRIHVGDFEQLLPRPAVRVDQGADIGVTLRDDTVKRSDDA